MSGPTDVREFGYDPSKMDLSGVRNTAEERTCAALGLPAAVIGFGTGLENVQVGATLKEFSRMAWVNGLIPMQNSFAGEIGRSLLPDFELHPQIFEVGFDRSKVEALQENQSDLFTRANIGVSGGWLTVAKARQMVGIKADPKEDDIYLRNPGVVEVPIGLTVADVQAENQLLMAPKRALGQLAPDRMNSGPHILVYLWKFTGFSKDKVARIHTVQPPIAKWPQSSQIWKVVRKSEMTLK